MDLRTFFIEVGGSYDEAIGRLRKEKTLYKFINKFTSTEEYSRMIEAYEAADWEALFRESHTLKGVCANLCMGDLAVASSDLCEMVRHGAPETDISGYIEKAKEAYNRTIKAIGELEAPAE